MIRTKHITVNKPGNGEPVDQMKKIMVMSQLVSRLGLAAKMGMQYGTDRDLYEALGYKTKLTYRDYLVQYLRQDIAKAIIKRPASASWSGDLRIIENEVDTGSPIELAWEELERKLNLKNRLMRADRLSGIGEYGILLLGLDDVKTREQWRIPVKKGERKLMYVKPFGQGSAAISLYEGHADSYRYGQPVIYDITLTDTNSSTSSLIQVHHSRVIHIVDDQLESEVVGSPRLEAVFNRLMDLEKLVGGSAEMFWRGARPGYSGNITEGFNFTDTEKEDLKDQIDEYEHNLRRILIAEGLDLKALAQQVADPKGHVDVQIQMISAVTGIPKRILMGSERGELASSQDRHEWLTYAQTRREEFVEPCLLHPFVDRCIEYGVLPTPKNDYKIQWRDLWAPSEKERVEIGRSRAESLGRYATTPFAEGVIPPEAFVKYFLGLDQDQIDNISKIIVEQQGEEQRLIGQIPPEPEE
ncbi:MAG: hypothetical protein A2Y71_06255 [Bacteroidetes bacterium RBG_13_42_15]|nr:MAG: hypothetical protein A2Y71_06255 [Bacteroidetes bacterium RBG_13_42_15]